MASRCFAFRAVIMEARISKSFGVKGCDPFNQNSNRSDREKRTTSKGGPVFSKLFRLDRTDPLSFGPKFLESLVEWIAPKNSTGLLYLPVSLSAETWKILTKKVCQFLFA